MFAENCEWWGMRREALLAHGRHTVVEGSTGEVVLPFPLFAALQEGIFSLSTVHMPGPSWPSLPLPRGPRMELLPPPWGLRLPAGHVPANIWRPPACTTIQRLGSQPVTSIP